MQGVLVSEYTRSNPSRLWTYITRNAKKCVVVSFALTLVLYLVIVSRVDVVQYEEEKEAGTMMMPHNVVINETTSSRFPLLDKDLSREKCLVYNRVPKCGSSTTSALFKDLGVLHHFKIFSVMREGSKSLDAEGQQAIIDKTSRVGRPWMYIQHFHMINFTDFGRKMPVHINIIRDPIERLMSGYYYKRFNSPRPMSEKAKNTTFENCVQRRLKECTNPTTIFIIVPYFCGSLPRCLEPSTWALERAKRNVERFYSLVGHVDELGRFYEVLEKIMPQYFSGLMNLYNKNVEMLKLKSSTKVEKTLSSSSRQYLRSLLGLEYEFYAYIKQRFEESYQRVMPQS